MHKDARLKGDLALAGVLLLIGVVYINELARLPSSSPNQADIGPRAYPQLLAVLLFICIALLVLRSAAQLVRRNRREAPAESITVSDTEGSDRAQGRRLLTVVALVVVTFCYLQVLTTVGFVPATAVYLAMSAVLIGGFRQWQGARLLVPVAFGCITTAVIYWVFADILGVLLPEGFFTL